MTISGGEYVRDSTCCQDLMEHTVGANDDGVMVHHLRCVACGLEYPEPRMWNRQEVRRRVKKMRRWLSRHCFEGDCGNCTAQECPCPHHRAGPLPILEPGS